MRELQRNWAFPLKGLGGGWHLTGIFKVCSGQSSMLGNTHMGRTQDIPGTANSCKSYHILLSVRSQDKLLCVKKCMVKYTSVFHPKEQTKACITHDCILDMTTFRMPGTLLGMYCYRFAE